LDVPGTFTILDAMEVMAALAGGVLIGCAVAMLLLLDGRVAGISGIVGGVLRPSPGEWRWQVLFVGGLLAGGLLARAASPSAIGPIVTPLPILAVAGILVGFGTSLGSGCTSGHGVCGVSRASPRSIAATATFMAVAAVVVFIVRHGARL
jgi:uncharacterized membrane protein YedE/YeeE